MTSDYSPDRSITYGSKILLNESAAKPSLDLSSPPRSCLVPTGSRRSYLLSRSIATRVPQRVKKKSSPQSTAIPVSSRDTPIYLIYFGVSIWAALAGYGAHFYFSSTQDDFGPIRGSATSDLALAISDLQQAFQGADRVITDAEVLKTYGSPKYTTYIGSEDARPHGVVVLPLSTKDVVAVVNIARKWGVPIVPFGNGTSLEGHTGGVRGPFAHTQLLNNIGFRQADRRYVLTCQGWIV